MQPDLTPNAAPPLIALTGIGKRFPGVWRSTTAASTCVPAKCMR